MLSWIFGDIKSNIVHLHTHDRASGYLEFAKARVRWFLSINYDLIPEKIKEIGQRTYRSIKIENEELEFSDGFVDLHTKVYQEILKGNGHTLNDARSAIEIVHKIRSSEAVGLTGEYHPLAKFPISKHPLKIKMKDHYDYIIVGGGIVGVSTAYKLALKMPNSSILILEKKKIG